MSFRGKPLRDRAARVIDKLPRLSVGANRFLAALARRDVENSQLIAIIQRDPMLAPRVLELANSSVFGRLNHIESIPHAVAMIGASTLRRYGLRWTFGGLFKSLPESPRWSTSRYTSHSEATALFAEILGDHLGLGAHAEGAFIAGMVHDIGKFVICAEASEEVDFILSMRALSHESATEVERDILGIDHAEISSMAADKWRLGDDVCEAILFHHQPERDPNRVRIPVSLVLSKADAFINGLGIEFLSTAHDASQELEWTGYEREVKQAVKAFQESLELNGIVI